MAFTSGIAFRDATARSTSHRGPALHWPSAWGAALTVEAWKCALIRSSRPVPDAFQAILKP
jgi:hypothetical protein